MLDATPLLALYARRRLRELAAQDPKRVQRAVLAELLRRAAHTRFGQVHSFALLRSISDYQDAVPLRRYEDFWSDWWEPEYPRLRDATCPGRIPWFALTSGTSGAPTKHIPVSRAMVNANARAARDVLAFHLAHKPQSRILSGRNFMLGGSTALERLAAGVYAGDLSGIAAANVPIWARARFFPPPKLALLADWNEKVDVLTAAAADQPITSFSGTPSWMLVFLDRLAARFPERPRRLSAFWPDLELVVHGGVSFAPYRPAFAAWLEGSRAETREVYAASEGFIAIADEAPEDGLRLILDNGLFYEFVPEESLDDEAPERRWVGDAELGRNYAIVLTTNAGLWSYVLGDTVEFTSLRPPRIRLTGRVSATLSAFGEHLIVQEVEAAVLAAAGDAGVVEYTAAPVFPDAEDARGGHVFAVEFAHPLDTQAVEAFARRLDAELARANADYAAHRAGDAGMRPPRVIVVRPGGFAAWMESRGKLGGQHKAPRVTTDPALLKELLRFA